jgi:hypothetical protein
MANSANAPAAAAKANRSGQFTGMTALLTLVFFIFVPRGSASSLR